MKLSVVMATYNGEKHVVEQMESLRTQVRIADEVLIFDDCSTDGTVSIIKDYIQKYELDHWKLTINEQNKGYRKNFIDGIMQAVGDLIFPCDQDDIWMPEKLAEVEAIMERHPEVGMLMTSWMEFYENGKADAVKGAKDGALVTLRISNRLLLARLPGCASCIRRSLVRWCQEYWEACFAHDTFFWLLSRMSDKLYYYGKPLIRQRRHKESATAIDKVIRSRSRQRRRELIEIDIKFILCLMRFIENEHCDEIERKKRILTNYLAFTERRMKFCDTCSLLTGIRLMGDLKFYCTVRQYLGDIYVFYMPESIKKLLCRFL